MIGMGAKSVLPWATFRTELVSVWPSWVWKFAIPSSPATSAIWIVVRCGELPGLVVSTDRLAWAMAPVAIAVASAAPLSVFSMGLLPECQPFSGLSRFS